MLHHALLPGHARWAPFLRRLSYVVIDECHTYRGVFGSHVAHVLRRLRRLAARYGSTPTFVLASATSGDPADAASRLTGLPVTAVTEDASPRGAVTFALWEPPLLPPRPTPTHVPPAPAEPATPGPALGVAGDRRPARRRGRGRAPGRWPSSGPAAGAEVVAAMTRRALDEAVPGLGDRVAAYRAGYLREDRRAIEQALLSGELLALASTNALELGVDLVGLDAVLICGYPGTRASLWQQAGPGRPGRRRGARGAGGPGRPARHLPGAPPGGAVRPAGRGDGPRPGQPVRARPAALLRRRPRPRSPRRPGAVRRRAGARRRSTALDRVRGAAQTPDGLVLDPPGPPRRRPARHRRRPGRGGRVGHRPPARHGRPGLVARHAPPRRGLPAPGHLLRGRRAGSGRRGRPGPRRRNRTGPPTPATSPTCRWSSVRDVRGRRPGRPLPRRGRRDQPGGLLPAPPHRHRRGDRHPAARPARPRTPHGRGLVHHLPRGPGRAPASNRPTSPAPCTPPSTPRSACCR